MTGRKPLPLFVEALIFLGCFVVAMWLVECAANLLVMP